MKAPVTGAQGFFGSAVRRTFLSGRHSVTAAGRRPGIGIAVFDLADPARLFTLLVESGPDVVVNCGALADFNEGTLPRQLAPNRLAPAYTGLWCAEHGAHLVHCSKILIHGARAKMATTEVPVDPDTDYGRSKALAEDLIAASGCRAAVIRIGGIFGAAGPNDLGLNKAIRGARQGQRPRLVGQGWARRNYIHVDDAAHALRTVAEEGLIGFFRPAGSETLTVGQMLQYVCDVYLPEQSPEIVEGPQAGDQIIDVSPELPPSRGFLDALRSEQ